MNKYKEEAKEYILLMKKADRLSYTNIMLQLGSYLENNMIRYGGRINSGNMD